MHENNTHADIMQKHCILDYGVHDVVVNHRVTSEFDYNRLLVELPDVRKRFH